MWIYSTSHRAAHSQSEFGECFSFFRRNIYRGDCYCLAARCNVWQAKVTTHFLKLVHVECLGLVLDFALANVIVACCETYNRTRFARFLSNLSLATNTKYVYIEIECDTSSAQTHDMKCINATDCCCISLTPFVAALRHRHDIEQVKYLAQQ